MNLSTKQKQHLKGLAHPLKPVVLLGSNGLTETGACNVQVIGKTLVLYRPTKERKISLPR